MTILEAAIKYGVCVGECGIEPAAHWKGVIDPFGVVHYLPRRFTRRALRNLLLLVAKRDRLANPAFLNTPEYTWYYLHIDEVTAGRLALTLGVRLPARLSRLNRLRCLQLARRRGVKLSKRSAVYAWAHGLD